MVDGAGTDRRKEVIPEQEEKLLCILAVVGSGGVQGEGTPGKGQRWERDRKEVTQFPFTVAIFWDVSWGCTSDSECLMMAEVNFSCYPVHFYQ